MTIGLDDLPDMPDAQPGSASAENRWKYWKYWVTPVVVLAVLALLWSPIRKDFFDKPPKPSTLVIADIDPLCQFVSGTWKLRCVVALAAEGVLGPGHYVNYDLTAATRPKVPFPNGSLFGTPCLVPGADATNLLSDLQKQEQSNEVNFERLTYKLDRHFQAGAELPVPKFNNLVLKAGPKLNEIQSIAINAPRAWIKIVDENQFVELLSRAAIRQNCIDNVITKKYNVISKAAIARDFDIAVTDTFGHSMGLAAAASNGQLTVDVGGDAGSTVEQTITKASSTPLVLAVDFFDPQIFSENHSRLTGPVFSSSGESKARVFGFSSGHEVLWQSEHSALLGEALKFEESHQLGQPNGTVGVCEPSGISTAKFGTTVTPQSVFEQPSQPFEIESYGFLQGGAIRGPFCAFIREASVQADISFRTQVETTVRSENASTLAVNLHDSLANPAVQVVDWKGKQLAEKSRSQEGEIEFALLGPGVYRTVISGTRRLIAHGSAVKPVNDHSRFEVSVR